MTKKESSNFYLLSFATFLHLFSLSCSFYKEVGYVGCKYPNGYKEINYWLYFFSWWSAQASLLTIIYFIYKLFKKKNYSYFDKVFDLVIINVNIVSFGIFAFSNLLGFLGNNLLPVPRRNEFISLPLGMVISSKSFWWFYSIIWHYLAPFLTILYFARRKISLAKTYFERKSLFLYSFLHPLFYLFFIIIRPFVPRSQFYPFGNEKYPYFFFKWVKFNSFFNLLTTLMIIFFWLFVFWLSTLLFWKLCNHTKLENEI